MTPSDLERVEVPPEPLADALGEFIDQTFPDTSVPVPVYLQTAQLCQRAAVDRYLASLPARVDVLDIGAAQGIFSRVLFDSRPFEHFTATWVDRDASAMDTGLRAAPFGAHVKRVPADLEDERWARMIRDEAFDCALIGLLHHHIGSSTYTRIIDVVIGQKLRSRGRLVAVELGAGLYQDGAPLQVVIDSISESIPDTIASFEPTIVGTQVTVPALNREFRIEYVCFAIDAVAVGR